VVVPLASDPRAPGSIPIPAPPPFFFPSLFLFFSLFCQNMPRSAPHFARPAPTHTNTEWRKGKTSSARPTNNSSGLTWKRGAGSRLGLSREILDTGEVSIRHRGYTKRASNSKNIPHIVGRGAAEKAPSSTHTKPVMRGTGGLSEKMRGVFATWGRATQEWRAAPLVRTALQRG